MRRTMLCVFVLAVTAAAQSTPQQVMLLQDKQHAEATRIFAGPGPTMVHASGGVWAGATVKGAPFSAEATTETVQILADGNRITSQTSNKSYRDSEGRTRIEITPSTTGAWMPDTKPASITVIDDPVSGDHFTLNNNSKVATRFSYKTLPASAAVASGMGKTQSFAMVMQDSGDVTNSVPAPPLPPPPPAAAGVARMTTTRAAVTFAQVGPDVKGNMIYSAGAKSDARTEPLGKQVIEGVQCTGTKETITVPAGAIGNERPLETVTERWYSPDLQLEVMTKTTDPRFGETSYRLTNIVRSEQPKSLFEVPADYKLEEPSFVNLAGPKTTKGDVR